jgi:hypothetical protein
MVRMTRSTLFMILCLVGGAALAQRTPSEAQRDTAQRFLGHYFLQHYAPVRPLLPDNLAAAFGPYPFAKPPTLGRPKVEENQALVEFSAPVLDEAFLPNGGLLMYREQGVWKLRQVLFYDKIPRLFNLPSRSVTAEDRQQEPLVRKTVEAFLDAWQQGNAAEMQQRWYAWPRRTSEPITGLSLAQLALSLEATDWPGTVARYNAKLTYKWGPFRYSMQFGGRVFLVQENEEWKIRENVLVFLF